MSAAPSPSATTAASNRFVADHLDAARALGERLVDLAADPEAFVAAMHGGFAEMADATCIDGIRRVTPGLGPILGVRLPLIDAAHKAFRKGTKRTPSALLLEVMDRLLREEPRELRWFGMWNLDRLLPADPARTWQLLRRAAGEADEWITVDTLAHPYGEGILRDPRRWAELQQLVYSRSRWERRLVGSTVATLPHVRRVAGGKDKAVAARGLTLIGQLIGDADPDVQKALSWALRTMAEVDPVATIAFLRAETDTARATADGHRAWVIRDSLNKLPDETAAALRALLEGLRRRPDAPSTSRAAATVVGPAPAAATARTAPASELVTAGAAPRPAQSSRED